MQHRSAPRASSFLCLLIAACASSSGQESAPVQVDELVTCIERVHVEADRARLAISDSFERLNFLAAGKFGKESAASAYARFVQSIDVADQQAKRFREVVAPMLAASQPVFTQWQTGLKAITSERLRQRSELRYAVTKERYEAITAVAVPARDQYDGFVKSLRDHAAFLAHDLNPGAIAEIQDDVKDVAKAAVSLDHNLETCLAAARAYVDQSALPAMPPTPSR